MTPLVPFQRMGGPVPFARLSRSVDSTKGEVESRRKTVGNQVVSCFEAKSKPARSICVGFSRQTIVGTVKGVMTGL